MQDLGIRVLFMGNNFARLLQGLAGQSNHQSVSGIRAHYAPADSAVSCVLRTDQSLRHQPVRRSLLCHRVYGVGNGGDGRFGAGRPAVHSETSI